MILVSYDIQDDRQRNKFSKFLKKFGRKIQYSVYEIKNSQRVLNNILIEIESNYSKKFGGSDSVIILSLCESCQKKIRRYGYSENEEKEVVVFG
ncbi:MAG: hypothetical protein KatS3mg098_054 [Candidatus Parcubacteria bacterium]|nr:CRISPR-associated endonuclease Cas2 [Patescibacteria group bacterium]BCX15825.1 MAG: hypothetical protein KatS3mg098_054 [Candidatus Parcubacteria bacterium]